VIGVLKVAFVQGRLTKDELDVRVGQTFASRTYGELAAVTADLPPGLATALPIQRRPARPRPPVSKVIAVAMLFIPPPAMVAVTVIVRNGALVTVSALLVAFYLMAWIVGGAQLIANWHDKSPHRRLPLRPAPGGQLPGREPGRRPGDDLLLCQASSSSTRAGHLPQVSATQRIRRSPSARPASAGLCT
jgi:hypothetical protein